MPGHCHNLFYLLHPQNESEASTKELILEMGGGVGLVLLGAGEVRQLDPGGNGAGIGSTRTGSWGTGCADSRPP